MVKQHRKRKKNKSSHFSRITQSESLLKTSDNKSKETNNKDPNSTRHFNHPYATRSKTLTNSLSMTFLDIERKRQKPRRRGLSDSSIIFIGAYRKIPQFIDLESPTGLKYLQQEIYEKINTK